MADKDPNAYQDVDEDDEGADLQPTYQLGPLSGEKFMQHEVREVLKEVMNGKLKDMQYDDSKVKQMSLDISDEAKTKIRGDETMLVSIYNIDHWYAIP
uniref:Uncharacterized protein n=1 Tax=Lotharella globosa TaxID=91324 RepID=A0A7S4DSL6_9EUKA